MTILTSLIPSLNSSGNGIQDDGEVEDLGVLPFVCDFLMKNTAIFVIELGDPIDACWALCHQGSLNEIRQNLSELVFLGECFDISD